MNRDFLVGAKLAVFFESRQRVRGFLSNKRLAEVLDLDEEGIRTLRRTVREMKLGSPTNQTRDRAAGIMFDTPKCREIFGGKG